MTEWAAIVPLKTAGDRKTRLSDRLSAEERAALSQHMFAHVVEVLETHPRIASIAVLSDQRPEQWTGAWILDEARGLNAELEAARVRAGETGLLILHADLPLLEPADIDALIGAAEAQGVAIAPDRHGSGTNALALLPGAPIAFRFGPDSFRLHRAQAPDSMVVERQGLALDLDTPGDLAAAEAAGFRPGG
jgi:2-phospho-L-lactate guanylyltransferase